MVRRQRPAQHNNEIGYQWTERYEVGHLRSLKLAVSEPAENNPSSDDIGKGEHNKVLLELANRHELTGDIEADLQARDAIIVAWNTWVQAERKKDRNFVPDLRWFNGSATAWRSTPLWGRSWEGDEQEQLLLAEIDLSRALLMGAHLEGVFLFLSDFEGANLAAAHLEGADLHDANLTGAWLRFANFSKTNVAGVVYRHYRGIWPFRRNLMLRRYLGIRGVESCYGSPGFRRDALDQDFIDQKYEDCDPTKWVAQIESKWVGWLLNARPVRFLRTLRWEDLHQRLPRLLFFWLWSLSDYGRSALGGLLYLAATIGLIGTLYQYILIPQGHVALKGDLSTGELAFAPWYAAGMGAATLGFSDVMRPLDAWGQLAMFSNALSGLALFGLIVAVLQNKVARRS